MNKKIEKFKKKLQKIIQKIKIFDHIYNCDKIKPFLVGGFLRDIYFYSFQYTRNINLDIDIVVLIYQKDKIFEIYQNYIKNFCNQCNYKLVELDNKRLVYRVIFQQHTLDFTYTDDLYIDYLRRDFTINSLYYDITQSELIYFDNSIKDIFDKKLKAVRLENLIHDPIRMLRAIRFKNQFYLTFDPKTYNFIKKNINQIQLTNPTRMKQEILKILDLDNSFSAFYDLFNLNFFEIFNINITDQQELLNIYKLFDLVFFVMKKIMQNEYNYQLKNKSYYSLLLIVSYLIKKNKTMNLEFLSNLFGENIVKKSLKIINDWNKRQNPKFIVDSFKHKNNLQIFELIIINLLLNFNKLNDYNYLSTLEILFKVCKYVCEDKENILSFDKYCQIFTANYDQYIQYVISNI